MKRLLALVLLLGGCASETPPVVEVKPTAGVAGIGCPHLTSAGRPVTFGPGNTLAGIVVGSGQTGVVLAHQASANLCQWLTYAPELAAKGFRVLAFDFAGSGSSLDTGRKADADVADAAAFLRADGATAIVLMGASRGGTAAVSAAAMITPAVQGVISLSAPVLYGGVDALAAAAQLKVPALFVCSNLDGQFAADATRMHGAAPGSKLVLVDDVGHGVTLMDLGRSEKATAAVNAFLAS